MNRRFYRYNFFASSVCIFVRYPFFFGKNVSSTFKRFTNAFKKILLFIVSLFCIFSCSFGLYERERALFRVSINALSHSHKGISHLVASERENKREWLVHDASVLLKL